MRFYNNRLLTINLYGLALGGQTVKKKKRKHEYNLRPNLSSTKINASRCKSMQVAGGQTKHKLNASPKLASICESVWPGLKVCQDLVKIEDHGTFVTFILKRGLCS